MRATMQKHKRRLKHRPMPVNTYVRIRSKSETNMISIIFEDQSLIVGNLDDGRAGNGVIIGNSGVGAS